MIDVVNTTVSALAGGFTAWVSMFINMIRTGTKVQTQLDSMNELTKHLSDKLDTLDAKYVTRREFELALASIQSSLGRIERLNEALVNRELNK
jgi:hypothetical protein